MNNAEEDNKLIKEILRGSIGEYEKLINKYQVKIRRFCMNMLANSEDADDAAQEVFIKSFRSLKTFHADSSFLTWLYKISSNHCKDLLRTRNKRKEQSWDALLELDREKFEALFSLPDNVALLLEHRELIDELLNALPVEQREVFIMREVEQMTYEEIAAAVDCTVDSVKGRLKRARERIYAVATELKLTTASINE